jgi:hypothetical protein
MVAAVVQAAVVMVAEVEQVGATAETAAVGPVAAGLGVGEMVVVEVTARVDMG